MNVNDFDIEVPEGDMLKIIFARQRSLMDKYHPIEERNVGYRLPSAPCLEGPHCGPLDLQDRASQLQLKSFAWRITEELTEATECLVPGAMNPGESNETHYLEEIVDALHFSVELCLMSGSHEFFLKGHSSDGLERLFGFSSAESLNLNDRTCQDLMRSVIYLCIEKLGEAMNRLKLKPWKSTAIITDVAAYRTSVQQFFMLFIDICKASGFNPRTLTAMYLNKNAVNQFRIQSNY